MSISYEWRGAFTNLELETLHGEGFDHGPVADFDWQAQLDRHSLGWVCARHDRQLVGFVNVAWDGSSHAFLLDTVVAGTHQRRAIGTELIAVAARAAQAAGCEWLHVDFEEHLRDFYLDACGFKPTDAGVLHLNRERPSNATSQSGRELASPGRVLPVDDRTAWRLGGTFYVDRDST